MSYVVLARKWRPQSFEDLVGQEHVSTTLANAIARDRVAHAFLFTGVRGVGKTTSARILAKTLNCLQGPTATPCQTCAPCKEITAGSDVDVQEIDGASYNGVDEIRRLQESLPYRPARDRFKIFIVDEVHMLSNSAWNAFLKTLEEPPPHVKFIFATTEVHKVPVTILSRCQRYDFKLLSAQTIAARLRYVLEREGVVAEEGAVTTLAREAAGSMRDAMSLLDQVIAWVGIEGDKLTAEGVARVLGVADRTVLHRLCDALVTGDAAGSLRIVGELAQEGYDLPHVARDILAHLRDLVVAKVCADTKDLLDLSEEEAADVKALATRTDADDLTRLHQGFSRSLDDVIRSGQPRAALEMTLVRLARRPPLVPIDELLRRLGDLERRLTAGGGGGAGSAGAPGGGSRPGPGQQPPARRNFSPAQDASTAPAPEAPSSPAPAQSSPAPAQSPPAPAQSPPAPAQSPPATASTTAAPVASPSAPPPAAPSRSPAPSSPPAAPSRSPAPSSPPAAPSRSPASSPPPRAVVAQAPPAEGFSAPLPSAKNGAPHARSEPLAEPPPSAGAPASPSPDLGTWRTIVDSVRARRAPLASVLEHAAVLQMGPGRVVLAFESPFLAAQATETAAKELLRSALTAHFGRPTEATFETASPREGAPLTVAQVDSAERKARLEAARRAVSQHPLVTAAIELLGADLQAVRLPPDAGESEPQALSR